MNKKNPPPHPRSSTRFGAERCSFKSCTRSRFKRNQGIHVRVFGVPGGQAGVALLYFAQTLGDRCLPAPAQAAVEKWSVALGATRAGTSTDAQVCGSSGKA